jgi:hypothetical protein
MHDVVAGFWCSTGDQPGVQRWLTVVEVAFGNDADQYVIVKVHGISAGRRHITLPPAHDLPRSVPQKILALDRGKAGLEAAIGHSGDRHDLFGVGTPDDFLPGVAIHTPHIVDGYIIIRKRFRWLRRGLNAASVSTAARTPQRVCTLPTPERTASHNRSRTRLRDRQGISARFGGWAFGEMV